jgi:hypothetical protein
VISMAGDTFMAVLVSHRRTVDKDVWCEGRRRAAFPSHGTCSTSI